VHTSAQALREAEERISAIEKSLVQQGQALSKRADANTRGRRIRRHFTRRLRGMGR